ncbi:CHAP domain-containing protein [Planomonospora sp. ID82291]|uniref:CHAP domain-containing protein n=1 Tax=Planomonospora sp. ID82291 TaxID=2738136 RepID=UPI0018C3B8D4|nr:CHAP domain-containing protein [Planomonospora sp. ID82291]MBG0817680.1 CHAP domain-containing protein [Planomonospora sp. ID82291]
MGKHRRTSPAKIRRILPVKTRPAASPSPTTGRRLTHVLVGASVTLAGGVAASPPAHAAALRPALPDVLAGVAGGAADLPASARTPLQLIADGLPRVSADEVLSIAASQIGVEEDDEGGGTRFHRWYMNSYRAAETVTRDGGAIRGYANAPWCAMFVSWVGERAGIRPVFGWDAYTVTYAQWFRANGHWGTAAERGALVFFDWKRGDSLYGIDHVGLVEKDNGDGTITTIEGNTGNGKVERRVRPKAEVVGYGYPVYRA